MLMALLKQEPHSGVFIPKATVMFGPELKRFLNTCDPRYAVCPLRPLQLEVTSVALMLGEVGKHSGLSDVWILTIWIPHCRSMHPHKL